MIPTKRHMPGTGRADRVVTTVGRKSRPGSGPNSPPNGSGRMAYAYARLRAEDEARSLLLDADPRTRIPDEDER